MLNRAFRGHYLYAKHKKLVLNKPKMNSTMPSKSKVYCRRQMTSRTRKTEKSQQNSHSPPPATSLGFFSHSLRHVLRSGAHAPYRQEDVVFHEVRRQLLDLAGERRRKHERLALTHSSHILLLQ